MKWTGLRELAWDLRKRFFFSGDECLVCGRRLPPFVSIGICRECFAQVTIVNGQFCRRCGRPVRNVREVCSRCQEISHRYFSVIRSLGVYDGMLQEWLYRVKYQGEVRLAGALGRIMALYLGQYPELKCDCVVPVPLHRERMEQRGYNQALVLAEEIARWRNIPVMADAVSRSRATVAQSSFGVEQRTHNVAGAFRINTPSLIQGRVVLLVDDIYTTGATLNELARVLLRAGAKEVKGYCLAVSVNDADLTQDANR